MSCGLYVCGARGTMNPGARPPFRELISHHWGNTTRFRPPLQQEAMDGVDRGGADSLVVMADRRRQIALLPGAGAG